MTLEPVFSWILALGCAALLAIAAVQKLVRWREFVGIVENYRIVSASFAPIAAPLVALSEAAAAVLLIPAGTRALGGTVAALLFAAYASAIALNLLRGRAHIDCGCVGVAKRRSIGTWMVWRNVALTIAAALAALPPGSRALSTLDIVTIGGSLLALVLLYLAFDQLGATTSRTRIAS